MLSPLRGRFGIPGVLAVIALVFAMVGGAFAASGGEPLADASKKNRKHRKGKNNGLNGKQKREVRRIAKAFQGRGPAGPQGPAGLAGPAGSNGSDGFPGLNGLPGEDGKEGPQGPQGPQGPAGPDGKSVLVDTFTKADEEGGNPPGEPCELRGGAEFEVEDSGNIEYVCNGEPGPDGPEGPEGSPWTLGGLIPPGETMTGYWAIPDAENTTTNQQVLFSFPLRLPNTISAANTHAPGDADFAENCTGNGTSTFNAQPGELCVYGALLGYTATLGSFTRTGGTMTTKVTVPAQAASLGRGSWAVTGCEAGHPEFPCP